MQVHRGGAETRRGKHLNHKGDKEIRLAPDSSGADPSPSQNSYEWLRGWLASARGDTIDVVEGAEC